ncbi:putative F-box domain-containing protein [Helianthus annuus]|uniref:F-box domain-containing protein n=1 Tax=Helianthus annuus TaxID=4232 RepID=A0A251SLR8_HELAN|nr:putative F-box domain-containing protein [Helianthus annuus]KAJ0465484.1 putative F-box domain-containing protein [Helianthus annuus]KAJ0487081.1 putative F-box domain-containing protein [Helianthus annuus]KAJ0661205.1 putative F-box domain-containing protein [Helianthus annuus]KAJ0841797.1 putative F-box domain-containing protein [Helianthus annuus]
MANVHIGDDVLRNILARLPGKPLLRFRCTSKHWNRLISDPYFMKSRSRRMVLFPLLKPLVAIDENVPVKDKTHSMVRIPSPPQHQEGLEISIVGTFNGIVLLALTHKSFSCQLILYNPLTCASNVLVVMDPPSSECKFSYVFGFGHGETMHDLKIVRFEFIAPILWFKWDVFDLKTSSWSTPQYMKRGFWFWGDVGVFLNGFLYWVIYEYPCFEILALNVKEMVFSRIKLPNGLEHTWLLLESTGGCLCVITIIGTTRFDMWLMKEECDENSWTKVHSFTFGLKDDCCCKFLPVCILGNTKILLTNCSIQLVIYDTSKGSGIMLNGSETFDHFERISRIFKFSNVHKTFYFKDIRSIEYVESLVSPLDICFI